MQPFGRQHSATRRASRSKNYGRNMDLDLVSANPNNMVLPVPPTRIRQNHSKVCGSQAKWFSKWLFWLQITCHCCWLFDELMMRIIIVLTILWMAKLRLTSLRMLTKWENFVLWYIFPESETEISVGFKRSKNPPWATYLFHNRCSNW